MADLSNIPDDQLDAMLAAHQSAISSAILGQESGNNPNSPTSINGAVGAAQIEPRTFKQYALPGEDINNPADNIAVHKRIIADLANKANGDPARIAVGYFSGPGNIAPPDSPTPYKTDHKDGNGKTVSSYVSDVLGRMNPVSDAQAGELPSTGENNNSGGDLSALSEAELDAKIAQLQEQSGKQSLISQAFQPIERIVPDMESEANAGLEAITKPLPENRGSFAKNILPAAGDVLTRAGGLGQYLGSPLTGAVHALAGRPAGDIAVSQGMSPQNAKAFVENPVTMAGSLLAPLGATKYAPEIAAAGSGLLDRIKNSALVRDESSSNGPILATVGKIKSGIVGPDINYDPHAAHASISDTYGSAKKQASQYYDFMRSLAEGKEVPSSGIKTSLDGIIDDISSDPLHEARSQLPYLKNLSQQLGESSIMSLPDAVKLKQNLNANFNPKRFSQGSDTPYQILGSSVDNSLNKAAKLYPDFGEAKSLADKNWLNTVKSPFEDNKILQQFWKPEDYYAKRSVDNGMLEELPDPTKQRAETMLTKIKTPTQLNAVRRVLSDEHANNLSQAKIQEITKGAGTSRTQAAGKTAYNLITGHLPSALRSGADIINPGYTDIQKSLLNAAKQDAPRLSTKYAEPFQDLQERVANPPPLPPQPQLALPDIANTTERPLIGGRSKAPRPATDEEWQNIIDSDRKNQEMGLPLDVRQAQQALLIRQYEEANPANNFFNKISDKPFRINQTALHPETGDVRTLFPDNGIYAKGGLVAKRKSILKKKHSEALQLSLKRAPKETEIELAHYVGPHGVKRLLSQKDAKMPAHKMFPAEIVSANRQLFFTKRKPHTVDDIRNAL